MNVLYYEDDLGNDFYIKEILVDLKDLVDEYCGKLVEVVVEFDEELMMKYLEGEEIIKEEFKVGICKGIFNVEFYFVVCGIVFKNKGV